MDGLDDCGYLILPVRRPVVLHVGSVGGAWGGGEVFFFFSFVFFSCCSFWLPASVHVQVAIVTWSPKT